MKEENFEKQDEVLMNQFKALRDKKIPSEVLDYFSASVEHKILEAQGKKTFRFGFPAWAPLWGPVLAVLLVAVSTTITRNPAQLKRQNSSGPAEIQNVGEISLTSHSRSDNSKSEISEDVALLQELGEWTDEDEAEFN